jgi:hypothetical protein
MLLWRHNLLQKPLLTTLPLFLKLPFLLIHNNSDCTSSDFLNIPHISDSDVKQAISHLHSTKCIRPDEIPNFITEGCTEIFTPLLRHIFNLSLLTGKFPSLWKQVAIVPIFKKDTKALVGNYRPILILNNFSKIAESIIHDHLSFYFKSKLHPNQHYFVKSKPTVTNLVTYLNNVLPSVCSQGQFDVVYFDLSRPSIKFLILFYY